MPRVPQLPVPPRPLLRDALPSLGMVRGVNDYEIVAHPATGASYTVATVPDRRLARLLVTAPRLVRTLDAVTSAVEEAVFAAQPIAGEPLSPTDLERHARLARTARRLLTALRREGV